MNLTTTKLGTLDSVFHSSENDLRKISISKMSEWLDSGLLAAGQYKLNQSSGMLGLYFKTNHWLDEFCDQHRNSTIACALSGHFAHVENTHKKLLRSVGRGANGGDDHRILSKIGAFFLRDQGNQWQFEQWFNRKRVDILSTDHDWVIECGDTHARPVIEHLYGGDDHEERCNKVGIIPFQEDFDDFYMYIFKRGPSWDESVARAIYWREDI